MRIQKGRVVGGKIVVDEAEPKLADGTEVTILVREPEDDEPVLLSPEQEAELLESIAEVERGELVPIEEVFSED